MLFRDVEKFIEISVQENFASISGFAEEELLFNDIKFSDQQQFVLFCENISKYCNLKQLKITKAHNIVDFLDGGGVNILFNALQQISGLQYLGLIECGLYAMPVMVAHDLVGRLMDFPLLEFDLRGNGLYYLERPINKSDDIFSRRGLLEYFLRGLAGANILKVNINDNDFSFKQLAAINKLNLHNTYSRMAWPNLNIRSVRYKPHLM